MSIDKKAIIQKQRGIIFAKPIVTQNPTFDLKQIQDFYVLFNLYADNRRQADMRQIVTTAKTLGYDKSHPFIFRGLVNITDSLGGQWIGFQQFLTLLTDTIGNPYTQQGRRQAFNLIDNQGQQRITFNALKSVASVLKLNLNEDQIQEAIQSIAGKGKQSLTWDQFNAFIAKKVQKKSNK